MKKLLGLISIILFILIFNGCSNKKMIRSDYKNDCYMSEFTINEKCKESSIEFFKNEEANFSLSYVEFDDQGLLHSRQQFNKVIEHISDDDIQDIVVFVHGWHHNAKNDDENVIDVRKYLYGLSKLSNSAINPRKIKGVYVGWRGDSIDTKYINTLTFYNRKDVSIEIGNGQIIELFIELEKIKKQNKKSRLFIIGHSFGGSIVLSSLNNILLSRSLLSQKGINEGFGDSIILLNPAIEGTQFFQLRELSERFNNNTLVSSALKIIDDGKQNLPKLLIVTSKGDLATGKAFPYARMLSTQFIENHLAFLNRKDLNYIHDKYYELDMDLQTVGNTDQFITHYLDLEKKIDNSDCKPWLSNKWRKEMFNNFKNNDNKYLFKSSKLELEFLNNSSKHDPFWVIKTNNDVIDGHNGIFKSNFGCFISDLYYNN